MHPAFHPRPGRFFLTFDPFLPQVMDRGQKLPLQVTSKVSRPICTKAYNTFECSISGPVHPARGSGTSFGEEPWDHAKMFAVLVQLHSMNASVSGRAGVSSPDGSEALTSALTAVGGGGGGAASSRLAATGQLTDSQLEEKQKSK